MKSEEYAFLIVDDSDTDLNSCELAVHDINTSSNKKINLLRAKSSEEYHAILERERVDGAIIDIQLKEGDYKDGNDIIKNIVGKYRIPIAIVTGNPQEIGPEYGCIKQYIKPYRYSEVINELVESRKTPLFRVLRSEGIIEEMLLEIFWKTLCPNFKTLETLPKDRADRIILRNVMAYLEELLDRKDSSFHQEEIYLQPLFDDRTRTGWIVCKNTTKEKYIVLSPPCDLEVYSGETKTDCVVLCEIENTEKTCHKSCDKKRQKDNKEPNKSDVETIVKHLLNNGHEYCHYLPKNSLFEGGLINFRMVSSVSVGKLKEEYRVEVRVHDSFVKEIMRRFSSYFARQGQPNLDNKSEISRITKEYKK